MQRRFVVTVVVILLMSTFVQTISAESLQQASGIDTVANSRINLRAGPGPEWKVLGTIEPGMAVRVDIRAPYSLWVRGVTADGRVGWMSGDLLSASAEQINALPTGWVDTPLGASAPAGGQAPAAVEAAPVEAPQQPAAAQPVVEAAANPQTSIQGDGSISTFVTNRVNLRTGPSTSQGVVLTLPFEAAVRLDGRDSSSQWARAILPDGRSGWLSITFVAVAPGDIARLPVLDGSAPAPQAAAPQAEAPQAAGVPAAPAPTDVPPAAPVVPVVNTAPVSGFSYGGHVEGFSDFAAQQMHRAGMTWVKRQHRYYPGQDAGVLAGTINDAHARGFRILIGIVGEPGQVTNPAYFDQYAAFVGGVAAAGADAIEVWNEMNIDREWAAGSIDAGLYVQLLRKAYGAIKAGNPNTMVISGAPAPTGYFGGCSPNGCDDNMYVAGMAAAGAANYMDCLGAHYNEGIIGPNQTSGDPRGNSAHYSRYFWGMINTYNRAFGGSRPICFTELGYLTPEGFPALPGGFAWAQNVTLSQQAQWLDQAVSLAAGSGRVRLVIVWNVDFTHYGDDPMAGYAIIRPGGGCPACDLLGR